MNQWSLTGKPALVVVHMQNSICKVGGSLEGMGHCKAAHEAGIIPNIQALLEAFRAKGLPVIYAVACHPTEFKAPVYGPFWEVSGKMKLNLEGTDDIEVIAELAPAPGEPVFRNWPFGIFQVDEFDKVNALDTYLRERGVDTVVLTGVATGMAVGHNAFALADGLYSVIVPSDTCTDANPRLHDAVISWMLPPIALITTAEDVIAHL